MAGRLERVLLVHPVASLVQLLVESRNSVDAVLHVLGSRSLNERLAAVLGFLKLLNILIESRCQVVQTRVVHSLEQVEERVLGRSCCVYVACAVKRVLYRVDVILIVDERTMAVRRLDIVARVFC